VNAPVRMSKGQRLRAELALLKARYDGGAVSPAVYQAIKDAETKLAWSEHHHYRMTAETQTEQRGESV
jgi:hypothetical protein